MPPHGIDASCHIPASPEKVDAWVVVVLAPSGVAPGEGAEEGVGEQTCHLLLRHGDGVVHAFPEERYWLEGEGKTEEGQNHLFFGNLANKTLKYAARNAII